MMNMTLKEMESAIGSPVLLPVGDITVLCIVKDVKIAWGKPRFLIKPLGGFGEKWVEITTIRPCTQIQRQQVERAKLLLA
jgi:hypothetical protein